MNKEVFEFEFLANLRVLTLVFLEKNVIRTYWDFPWRSPDLSIGFPPPIVASSLYQGSYLFIGNGSWFPSELNEETILEASFDHGFRWQGSYQKRQKKEIRGRILGRKRKS